MKGIATLLMGSAVAIWLVPAFNAKPSEGPSMDKSESETLSVESTRRQAPRTVDMADGENAYGEGASPGAPSSQPILTGEDMNGVSYVSRHIETDGMQLLQHYGATTGTVKLTSPAEGVLIAETPRPVGDSYPVLCVFLERIEGGKYLRIPLLTDYEVRNARDIRKDVEIPAGTYRVTFGFFKSSKPERTQLEIHSIQFEGAQGEAAAQ